jgi:hypothetical protein
LKTAANLGVTFAVLLSSTPQTDMTDQTPLVIRNLKRGTEQDVTVGELLHAPAKYLATDRP